MEQLVPREGEAEIVEVTGEVTHDVPDQVASEVGARADSNFLNENSSDTSVALSLQAAGVTFNMKAQANANPQLISMTAQIELLNAQVLRLENKLDQAMVQIGYLSAKLEDRGGSTSGALGV